MTNSTGSNIDSDTGITEKVYATSEVAKMVGIAPVTVRKYSQELENKGYVFIRSKVKGRQKARLYRYRDVESLRYLKEIREESNITVDQATSITIERLGKWAIQGIASNDTEKTKLYSNQYDELKDMIQKLVDKTDKQSDLLVNQSELILNLTDKIEQQEKYISNQLASPGSEQKQIEAPKLDEAPKEIEEASTEEFSAKGIEAYSDIEAQKEFDVFFKGENETVEEPKENEPSKLEETNPGGDPEIEEPPNESPSKRSKKEKVSLVN